MNFVSSQRGEGEEGDSGDGDDSDAEGVGCEGVCVCVFNILNKRHSQFTASLLAFNACTLTHTSPLAGL